MSLNLLGRLATGPQSPSTRLWIQALALGLLLTQTGCTTTRQWVLQQVGHEWAKMGADDLQENDLVLARDASAFYLKVSESLLRAQPDDVALAQAVASGFTQYAFAFVAQPADQLEARDARAAQAMRERAARLYARAKEHAITALNAHHPEWPTALTPDASRPPPPLPLEHVGLVYWTAASWAAQISLSKDHPEVVADLPRVMQLAQWAYARQPRHGDGALASLMGTLALAAPPGTPGAPLTPAHALQYFDQAIDWGGQRWASAYVTKAESWALPQQDKPLFEALLHQAIEVSHRHPSLANEVMRSRAEWLLTQSDDLF